MPTWGPVTVTNGPGTVTPSNFRQTLVDIVAAPGDLITQVTGQGTVTFSGGRSDAVFDVAVTYFDANGVGVHDQLLVQQRLTNPTWIFSWQAPAGIVHVTVTFGSANYAGQTMTNTANGDFSDLLHCAYGTERNSSAPAAIVLSLADMAAWLSNFGVADLVGFFGALVGTAVDLSQLCQTPPGTMPVVNAELATWSYDEQLRFMKVVMWFTFCQCVPGTPAPTPFPVPVIEPGPNVPQLPTFPCDPADLCASIAAIRNTLFQVQQVVGQIAEATQLVQRYEVPFAYVLGAVHSNLVDQGGFALPRSVGLAITVTVVPEGQRALEGNPPYLWDLGWLAILDANGTIAEKRLSQQQFVWLHDAFPTATRFQYWLHPGVGVRVQELYAEP